MALEFPEIISFWNIFPLISCLPTVTPCFVFFILNSDKKKNITTKITCPWLPSSRYGRSESSDSDLQCLKSFSPPPQQNSLIQKGRLNCALQEVAHNLHLLHVSEKIQATPSILGLGNHRCLTSYNSDIIYLTWERIWRRDMTDSKTADCKVFFFLPQLSQICQMKTRLQRQKKLWR